MLFPQLGPQYYKFHDIITLICYSTKGVTVHEIIGKKFGKWTVIQSAGRNKNSDKLYSCLCDCGTEKIVRGDTIKQGKSLQCTSCRMKSLNSVEDLIGKQFGSWAVLEKIKNEERNEWLYKCSCKCGTERLIPGNRLKSGETTKCHRCRVKTHGMSSTDTFRIWTGILRRCTNPVFKYYKYYGGRGIKVCDRWLKFENFFSDMGHRPQGLQIDRIDNDGNYESSNCRWVTPKENNANRKIPKNKKEN